MVTSIGDGAIVAPDFDALDPGIRDIVAAFIAAGFQTVDSGDGVSKAATYEPGTFCDFPHVAVESSEAGLGADARRVRAFVRDRWPHAEVQPSLYWREDESLGGMIFVAFWTPGRGYA